VILPLVDRHGGRIIDTAGDGILAVAILLAAGTVAPSHAAELRPLEEGWERSSR
jgi:hypothetical protein